MLFSPKRLTPFFSLRSERRGTCTRPKQDDARAYEHTPQLQSMTSEGGLSARRERDDLPASEDVAIAKRRLSNASCCSPELYISSFSAPRFFLLGKATRRRAFSRIFIAAAARGKLRLQWNSLYSRCAPMLPYDGRARVVLTDWNNTRELKRCNHDRAESLRSRLVYCALTLSLLTAEETSKCISR